MIEDVQEQIEVLTVIGKKYRIDEGLVSTVQQLKRQLQTVSGILPENQLLIINGVLNKDQDVAVSSYGSKPVIILAEKDDENSDEVEERKLVERRVKKFKTQVIKQITEHVCSCINHLKSTQFKFEPFLSEQEEQNYKREIEGLCPLELTEQLMELAGGINRELAVRALRASSNDLSAAFDFVMLEQKGENFVDNDIGSLPAKYPQDEQLYLRFYAKEQRLRTKFAEDKQRYKLFVASTKENCPALYQLLVRNKRFMEKLLILKEQDSQLPIGQQTKAFNHDSNHTPNHPSSHASNSLRLKLQRVDKRMFIERLMDMGLPQNDAITRLRQAGNNPLLAQESILSPSIIYKGKQKYLLSKINRELILKAFFQNPLWAVFMKKIERLSIFQAYDVIIRKLKKHSPIIFQMVNANESILWCIYPLLLGVPYSQIESVRMKGESPKFKLRRRSQEEKQNKHHYYSNLVDKDAVQIFVSLGVGKNEAETALRAAKNYCYEASQLLLIGKIPYYPEPFAQTEQNEMKMLDSYMRYECRPYLSNAQQFDLHVASLAEIHPYVYEIFLKYEGIEQVYSHLAPSGHYAQGSGQRRSSMKKMLKRIGDIRNFYEWGRMSTLIMLSQMH